MFRISIAFFSSPVQLFLPRNNDYTIYRYKVRWVVLIIYAHAIVIHTNLDKHLNIKTIRSEYDNNGKKRLFITASINSRIVTSPPLTFHPLYRADNYGSLQEIINSSASLSPNEATRIGPSADGDVVQLIAALPWCVRRSSRCCPGISSYGYARQP